MKLNRESEYGLRALMLLAREPSGEVMLLSDIAVTDGLPRYFVAKIFQKLTRHGVLRSFRGATRGYALARRPSQISVREILEAIEGPDVFKRCVFWSDLCSDANPCALHDRWKEINRRLMDELMTQTLQELVDTQRSRGRASRRSIPAAPVHKR